jgi:hypothetical protein
MQLLQRVAATGTTSSGGGGLEGIPPEARQHPYFTRQEAEDFTLDQIAFLARKRRAMMGLGPVMPASGECQRCGGTGARGGDAWGWACRVLCALPFSERECAEGVCLRDDAGLDFCCVGGVHCSIAACAAIVATAAVCDGLTLF